MKKTENLEELLFLLSLFTEPVDKKIVNHYLKGNILKITLSNLRELKKNYPDLVVEKNKRLGIFFFSNFKKREEFTLTHRYKYQDILETVFKNMKLRDYIHGTSESSERNQAKLVIHSIKDNDYIKRISDSEEAISFFEEYLNFIYKKEDLENIVFPLSISKIWKTVVTYNLEYDESIKKHINNIKILPTEVQNSIFKYNRALFLNHSILNLNKEFLLRNINVSELSKINSETNMTSSYRLELILYYILTNDNDSLVRFINNKSTIKFTEKNESLLYFLAVYQILNYKKNKQISFSVRDIKMELPNNIGPIYSRYVKNEDYHSGIYISNKDISIEKVLDIIIKFGETEIENWDVKYLKVFLEKSKKMNYKWATLEALYLLNKIPDSNKWNEEYKNLQKKIDFIPLSSYIDYKTLENKFILELNNIIYPKTKEIFKIQNGKTQKKEEWRLIWVLIDKYNENSIYPRFQKKKELKWLRGTEVDPSKIRYNPKDYGASDKDILIANLINNRSYNFNLNNLAHYLVGIENLYHSHDFSNNIIVEEGLFPINLYDTDYGYKFEFKYDIKKIDTISFIQSNDYTYRVVQVNKSTMEFLNLIKKSNFILSKEKKDTVVKWIENNKLFDINCNFCYPQDANILNIKAEYKISLEISKMQKLFKVNIKLSPYPDWEVISLLKKGKTIVKKVNLENQDVYHILERDINKENKLYKSFLKKNSEFFNEKSENENNFIYFMEYVDVLEMIKLSIDNQIEIKWSGNKKFSIKEISFDDVEWKVKSKNNWFSLSVDAKLDNNERLNLNKYLKEFKTKNFSLLENDTLYIMEKKLQDIIKKIDASSIKDKDSNMLLHPLVIDSIESLFVDTDINFENIKNYSLKLKEAKELKVKLPLSDTKILRSYQKVGVKWIYSMTSSGFGVCLADDMGIGKTIQAIKVISLSVNKALIVVPAAVLYNWQEEFKKFSSNLKPVIYEGENRKELLNNLVKESCILVSYDTMIRDFDEFKRIKWEWIILDEAQKIKNSATIRAKLIYQLNAKRKVALTGTPIENHLGELWSLFRFLNPELLGAKQFFNTSIVKPILTGDAGSKKSLKTILSPFILRRLKSKVLKELPPKTEQIKWVDLSGKSKAYYEALRINILKSLSKDSSLTIAQKRIKILSELTKLRLASCDISMIDDSFKEESSKNKEVIELIKNLLEANHKMLIFSQFVKYLSIIKEILKKEKIDFLYLDGSTPKKKRQELVNEFNSNKNIKVFLISLRAGGVGLNLTSANYVIHLDPWWNPAVEDQATDRTHRIGQSKEVTVYRMIVKNSIEEKIIKLHESKRQLSESILDNMDKVTYKLSVDDLINLIS